MTGLEMVADVELTDLDYALFSRYDKVTSEGQWRKRYCATVVSPSSEDVVESVFVGYGRFKNPLYA